MHYLIDGYNMLFRLIPRNNDLQSQREAFIQDLNKKISLIKLDVSIIFDSAFQLGGRSRTHYDALEIHYSAEGETADEYILDELKNSYHPQQEIVVTSDKKLAWQSRHYSARTESVEEFITWLNRSYKNKLKQLKTLAPTLSKRPLLPPPISSSVPSRSLIPSKEAPLEAYSDYYEKTFEAEWQQIQKEEQLRKQASAQTSAKKNPRKPRRVVDPFQAPLPPEVQATNETERWLKTFEKRLLDFLE